jgi:hypothetical protein
MLAPSLDAIIPEQSMMELLSQLLGKLAISRPHFSANAVSLSVFRGRWLERNSKIRIKTFRTLYFETYLDVTE